MLNRSFQGLLLVSVEDDFVAGYDHFNQLFIFQEQDVGRSSDHRVQTCLFNVEVDIETVKHLEGDITEERVDHANVAVAASDVFGSLFADLDPSRVERSVLVLVRADQDHVLEPPEAFFL